MSGEGCADLRAEIGRAAWVCARASAHAVAASYMADASQMGVDVLSKDAQIAAAADPWAFDAKEAALASHEAAKNANMTMNSMLAGAVTVSFAESSIDKDCQLAAVSAEDAAMAARACFMVIGGVDPLPLLAGDEE